MPGGGANPEREADVRAAKRAVKRVLAACGYEIRNTRARPEALERPWALLSFHLPWVLTADDDHLARKGHAILWEDRELARSLWRSGYNVRAVHWTDTDYRPERAFSAVLDLGGNLARLDRDLPEGCAKLLYCVFSDPRHSNAAEAERVRALNERRGAACKPRRQIGRPEAFTRSLEICDAALLNGNEHTLATYPAELRHKMRLTTTPGSFIGANRKPYDALAPAEREFLWYFGVGAVHKGLDLVLEVFARHPELVLHVVGGDLPNDPDFVAAYRRELTTCDNIRVHGRLLPHGPAFAAVAARCCAFVAPSCAESASPAVVTCLKVGMYPIVSRDCGITLLPGAGRYLETCTVDEIEEAVLAARALPATDIRDATAAAQADAERRCSLDAFSRRADEFLEEALLQRRKEGPW